ncbi:hypothetical protein PV-S19_0177 [Pacmanvirus S19]|nr:hypothetical protein PV-S19_0177 [Pacmanvirus S19]
MQIDLPNEMIVEIFEAAIKNGITGVVYPLACADKHWNEYIKSHIDAVLEKNIIIVANSQHEAPNGEMYSAHCVVKNPHCRLPNGLLHGVNRVFTSYESINRFENLRETYLVGKRHGYASLNWISSEGEECAKTQNWVFGVRHGIKLIDIEYKNSIRVITTRRISMYSEGTKLPISFSVTINRPKSGDDPTVEINAKSNSGDTAIKKCLKDIPALDDLDAWQQFYFDLASNLN